MRKTGGCLIAIAMIFTLGTACSVYELDQLDPNIWVDPEEVSFGSVIVNTANTANVTIHNVGGGTLTVNSVTLQNGNGPFTVQSYSGEIVPDNLQDILVTFEPLDLGPAEDVILIDSNDPDEPIVEVPIYALDVTEGPEPAIAWSPTSIDYGPVPSGGEVIELVVIQSIGTAPLQVSNISLAVGSSSDFYITEHEAPTVLDPSDDSEIFVAYAPSDNTADAGTLVVESNDPNNPEVLIPLTGELQPAPDIDLVPSTLDFGQVDIGSSLTLSAEIWSVGDDVLELGQLSLNAGAEFTLDLDPSNESLPVGQSTTVTVTYTPVDMTPDTGEVAIPSNDPDEPTAYLMLIAETPVPDIDLNPTTLDFGQVQVGSYLSLQATISNVGGADLDLGELFLDSMTAEYTLTVDPSYTTLVPSDFTVVEVTYTPVDGGTDTGVVEIPSNDPDEPIVYLNLTGSDLPLPDIDVWPLTIDFGTVVVGTSATEQVEVANVGTADLDVTSLTLATGGEFSFNCLTLPGIIVPGGVEYIDVTYTPVDNTADYDTLTIASNDPDEPTVEVELIAAPTPQPDIDVDPWTVDFGDVKINTTENAWVTIYNVGNADLNLNSISVNGPAAFAIPTNPQGTIVGAGGDTQMQVSFTPTYEIPYTGMVDIDSNDPDEPTVYVDLLGDGATPEIEIDPWYYDFGQLNAGCPDSTTIYVRSVGAVPLEVYGYNYTSSPVNGFTLDGTNLDTLIAGGGELVPGDSVAVTVDFYPDDVTNFVGMLAVSSDDPLQPTANGDQEGDGLAGGYYSDNFNQQGNNQTDVIWTVDNSCSMSDEQSTLGDDFQDFYTVISNAGVDFHISVNTTDSANFRGSPTVIDQYTPNGATTFASNCAAGTTGSATERGLMYGYNGAVMAQNGQSPNQNFWRTDAGLRVIWVSDEPDYSGGNWSTWVSQYQALKTNPDHVILSAICGTNGYTAQSCNGAGGSASAGTGYVEAANATGGVLGVICDANWSSVMNNLGWISVSLSDTFPLTYQAIPNTITVYVNGIQVTNGWTYDSNINSVVFDPNYVPNNGDTVDIDYAYYGSC